MTTGHTNNYLEQYRSEMQCIASEVGSRTGWLVDWFPEPMPLENKHGTSMMPLLKSLRDPPELFEDEPNAGVVPPMSVLIFADSYGYATNILKYAPKDRVGRKQIVTTAPGQLTQKRVESILEEGFEMMIFACGIDEPKNNTSEEIHKTQKDVMNLLLMICKVINDDKSKCSNIAVITCDQFAEQEEIHKQCGVGLITNSTLFGFCNTVRLELALPIQYIDTEWSLPETMFPALSSEVFRSWTFGRNSVRILTSGRYVLRQVNPVPTYTQNEVQVDLPTSGIIAISGGNGGVAIIIGHWLLKQLAKRGIKDVKLMFLSRSMRITDANTPFWNAVKEDAEKFGIHVEQAKGDVSNKESVQTWVKEHSTELAGFVHSAGVLADAMLFKVRWEDFETVWNPKSRAAMWLHEAFEEHGCPIKLFWMFSSVAVFGNPGQLNYSASNALMDGLVRHRRALGKAAQVLAWGPWGEVGMATTLDANSKRRMAEGPLPYFTNAEGIAGLETVLSTGVPCGQVFKINPDPFGKMVNNPITHPTNAHIVNFYAATFPPMTTLDMKPDNAYWIWKSVKGHAVDHRKGLVYQHYVKPLNNYSDDEED